MGEKSIFSWTSDRADMGSSLFSVPTLEQQVESLRPGDQVCVIQRGESLTRSVIVPFVRRCLARKEMCFYTFAERAADDVASELPQAGIDVEQARERRAPPLPPSRPFLPLAKFEPFALIPLFPTQPPPA